MKLFHKATIFDGAQGLASVNDPSARVRPVARGASNMSPPYSTMCSPSSTPNPVRPSFDRNRAQRIQRTDLSKAAISAGLRVTLMPHSSMTASFSFAVPLPPEMIAPA